MHGYLLSVRCQSIVIRGLVWQAVQEGNARRHGADINSEIELVASPDSDLQLLRSAHSAVSEHPSELLAALNLACTASFMAQSSSMCFGFSQQESVLQLQASSNRLSSVSMT